MMPYRAHVIISGEPEPTEAVRVALVDRLNALGLAQEIEVLEASDVTVAPRGVEMVVYPEGVHYVKLTPDDARLIAEEHLYKGRPVTRLMFQARKVERLPEPST
ncbi:MAG TPA: NADH-quinone oxidoreductase subunit F, partial [Chloroflexi bacterium]|nr:NADH-quinone oxidoreductase subunit F [Chloroflexota bacterium]